ncbi:sugar ABC transporter substrate-binding protein [Bacillus sp. FJAT-50079]|uniref:ABC transporter substrate-binding protein n=1 Tax=Bacillus sp. FJAT-50079 TaxID=2833577 RepID=UPI00201669B6|nr:sugar ABC transporter substrate-binding protein [Bacillus sp. FJAT-50079]
MKTLKRGLFSILLVIGMLMILVGCSSENKTGSKPNDSNSNGKDGGDEITLEFQQWWGVELPDGVLQEIVDGFTAETGIKIKLLSNPYADTKTQIAAGAASGTMADVVGLDGSWVYDFAKQGSIANLTALMEADGYDDSQLSDQIRVDGNTYMIPVANFAYPMYVNLDILEEAGIEEIPKTWSEFSEVTSKISTSTGKAGWAIPLSTESPSGIQNNFMSWLWASGGSMLNDGKPALTNNEDLTATVEFVKDLFDAEVVAPGAYAMKESDMVEEFTNGRIAFMTDSLAHLSLIKKGAPDLNFDFVPIPVKDGYSGESGMDVANWGIGIAENSKHKAEAMKFIEYLMSPEVNAEIAVHANAFPGNTKADPDYSSADELFLKAYKLYQDSYAVNEFTGLPISEELMRTFDEQLQLYLDGDTSSANDMLEETQQIWEQAFN